MWHNIFSNISPIFYNSVPQKGIRCFIYAFAIIAAVWLTIAFYFYYTEEIVKSTAAFIIYGACILTSLFLWLWELYLKRKALRESAIGKLIEDGYPVLKTALSKLQRLSQDENLNKIASAAMLAFTVFSLFSTFKKSAKEKK